MIAAITPVGCGSEMVMSVVANAHLERVFRVASASRA
jgi:hypothetical protein